VNVVVPTVVKLWIVYAPLVVTVPPVADSPPPPPVPLAKGIRLVLISILPALKSLK
jgi:hypothetical protein